MSTCLGCVRAEAGLGPGLHRLVQGPSGSETLRLRRAPPRFVHCRSGGSLALRFPGTEGLPPLSTGALCCGPSDSVTREMTALVISFFLAKLSFHRCLGPVILFPEASVAEPRGSGWVGCINWLSAGFRAAPQADPLPFLAQRDQASLSLGVCLLTVFWCFRRVDFSQPRSWVDSPPCAQCPSCRTLGAGGAEEASPEREGSGQEQPGVTRVALYPS